MEVNPISSFPSPPLIAYIIPLGIHTNRNIRTYTFILILTTSQFWQPKLEVIYLCESFFHEALLKTQM